MSTLSVATITGVSTIQNTSSALTFDATGRVLFPSVPAWCGQTGTFSGTVTGGSNHVSGTNYAGTNVPNGVLVNRGSYWNTTTGRFTAPVAGLYYIGIIAHKDANTASRDCLGTLSINGSYFEAAEIYGNYGDGGAGCVVSLSANDWVEGGRNNGFTNTSRITFFGFLIG